MYKEFLSIDIWTIINTWLNLLVLCFLVKKFLFKPVMNILQKREMEIAKNYEDADRAVDEAQKLKQTYEEQMKSAKTQAADIVSRATKKADDKGEEILEQAREKALALTAKAEAETKQIRKKAAGEMKSEMGDIALDIAKAVLQKEIDPSDHARLVDEFISNVGEDKWQSL